MEEEEVKVVLVPARSPGLCMREMKAVWMERAEGVKREEVVDVVDEETIAVEEEDGEEEARVNSVLVLPLPFTSSAVNAAEEEEEEEEEVFKRRE